MGTIEYHAAPVRSMPEYTVRIDAGVVTLGAEYRHLDEATVLAELGVNAEAQFNGGQRPAGMGAVLDEDGLSLHVWNTDTGDEIYRADCFDDAPHLHYITPGDPPTNVVVEHDRREGPLVERALVELANDLGGILRRVGMPEVADALDPAQVALAVRTLGQVARYVEAAGRPIAVG